MLRIWGAHTVVAKSPQTVPNVGIQQVGLDLGVFLDASLSSRSKADTSALASLRLHLHGPSRRQWHTSAKGVRAVRVTRVHMYAIHMTNLLPKDHQP